MVFFVDLLESELQAIACQNFIIFSVDRGGGGGALDTLQQFLLKIINLRRTIFQI
jgi:hypothetical protein